MKNHVSIKDSDLDFSELTERDRTNIIVVHHTGSATDDDLSAKEIHEMHKACGWAGIGYHYVIRKDGTIERGRPRWAIGSHAFGRNFDSIGVHVCGNFEYAKPTDEQLCSLALLIAELCEIYGLIASSDVVVAHRDLMPTACCGQHLYDKLQEVRGNAEWFRCN